MGHLATVTIYPIAFVTTCPTDHGTSIAENSLSENSASKKFLREKINCKYKVRRWPFNFPQKAHVHVASIVFGNNVNVKIQLINLLHALIRVLEVELQ